MKKIILLLSVLMNGFLSISQDTLFYDDFERSSLGSNYTAYGSPTITMDGHDLIMSGGSAQTKYVKYTDWGSCLEHWKLVIHFKVATQNATAQGIGIGIRTNSAFGNRSYLCQFAHGTGASKGRTYILAGTAAPNTYTQKALTSAQSVSVNDEIRLTVTRDNLTITALTENLTASTSTTVSYTLGIILTTGVYMHNTGSPYIVTAGGTQNIHDWVYTTTEPDSINTLFLGNSITHGISNDSIHKRFANKIMDTTSVLWQVNSGPGDYTASILTKLKELTYLKPKYCVIMAGGNDIAFGIAAATYKANYASFVQTLKDSGTVVIHCLATPRNAYDMTALNNWIVSTYLGTDTIVDTYTPLWSGTGTGLNATYDSGDGSHPNSAGHALIATTINNKVGYIRE